MSSQHSPIRETLERLQTQLEELREADPAVATRLAESIGQAKAVLAGKATAPEEHHTVVNQLSEAVLEIEALHPTLAGNLGGLIDALGRMGI